MLKTIAKPGKTFKMGRRIPVARCPRLSLKNYLLRSIPNPPESVNYGAPAAAELANIYENDTLGDCVIAGMGHIAGVLTAGAGDPLMLTDAQVISLYSAIGGYVLGDESTDNGCDEQTALNYWKQTGLIPGSQPPQHKISGWLSVNGNDLQEARIALWLFENLMFGVSLPDAWVNSMPQESGFVWNVAGEPDPNNGHCFIATGYDQVEGFQISTWGMTGTVRNNAARKYTTQGGGELYTVLSEDAIQKASLKAPNGFNWAQLVADFNSLA